MSNKPEAAQGSAAAATPDLKFKNMTPSQKCLHLLKLVACLATFGFAFPNVFEGF